MRAFMKSFINSKGEIVNLVETDNLIQIPEEFGGIEECFYVDVYDTQNTKLGEEYFSHYPEMNQIYYSICKHEGIKAEVRKIYEVNINI
jgi:hypothetical protein